jgi:hypothetical protein
MLLWGGSLAAVAIVAAIFGRRVLDDEQRRRTAEADYLAGRVSLVDGWIVSQSEADSVKR